MNIKSIISFLLVGFCLAPCVHSQAPLVYEGAGGPGKGKHIVFLSGDHEYRSEETLPALARVLAKNQGFKCTVLFNVDAASGEIVPGNSNLPGIADTRASCWAVGCRSSGPDPHPSCGGGSPTNASKFSRSANSPPHR